MTTEIKNKEIVNSFNDSFNLARQAINTGEWTRAIEILEQLKECTEMENLIDMALDFARDNAEKEDIEEIEEEDLTEESLAKEFLKLNPDAKISRGKRKAKKASLIKRLWKRFYDWVNKE